MQYFLGQLYALEKGFVLSVEFRWYIIHPVMHSNSATL